MNNIWIIVLWVIIYSHSAGDPQPPVLSVVMNKKVTASCSVSHSCPVIPPRFSWSHPGNILRRSKKLNTWKWETVSTLTFSPQFYDFNKPLNCTVHYRGGKKVTSSTIIKTWREPSARVFLNACSINSCFKKF